MTQCMRQHIILQDPFCHSAHVRQSNEDTNVLPAVDELMPLFQSDSPIDLDFSIVYDEAKQQLKCQTDVTFLSDYENPLYHTVVLVEEVLRVLPVISDQANFYSGGGYGNLGGFENKPPYIPARNEMVYRFVGRKAFNGVYGSKVYVDMQAGQNLLPCYR